MKVVVNVTENMLGNARTKKFIGAIVFQKLNIISFMAEKIFLEVAY